MGLNLNMESLRKFADKGGAAQQAVKAILAVAKKCPHCGGIFLPQSWNAKFCSYRCRWARREELKRKSI